MLDDTYSLPRPELSYIEGWPYQGPLQIDTRELLYDAHSGGCRWMDVVLPVVTFVFPLWIAWHMENAFLLHSPHDCGTDCGKMGVCDVKRLPPSK